MKESNFVSSTSLFTIPQREEGGGGGGGREGGSGRERERKDDYGGQFGKNNQKRILVNAVVKHTTIKMSCSLLG